MKKLWSVFLLVIAAIVFGCWLVPALDPRVEFNVVMLKREGDRVYDVRVSFEGFPLFRFGDLRAMKGDVGQSSFLMHYGIWPSEVEVEWKEGSREGETKTEVLPVTQRLSSGRDEQLQLVIEFKEGEIMAYPRVRESLKRGLSYRYVD